MVFPLQQAATKLDKKETSRFTRPESFPSLLKKTMKGSVACKATTGVQYLLQGALVPCLCGSSLHVAKFLVLVWYHDVLLQVYKMQHCYTATHACAKRTG